MQIALQLPGLYRIDHRADRCAVVQSLVSESGTRKGIFIRRAHFKFKKRQAYLLRSANRRGVDLGGVPLVNHALEKLRRSLGGIRHLARGLIHRTAARLGSLTRGIPARLTNNVIIVGRLSLIFPGLF